MMKILVLSDSHGWLDNAASVLTQLGERMDMVFHLGDFDEDAILLAEQFPQLPFHMVKGNNDFSMDTPSHKLVSAGGRRFLLTHGHRQRVYSGLDSISYWAEEQGADLALFGHTHVPLNDGWGRVHLFNPGSISMPRDSRIPTFGILTVEQGRIEGAIMEYREGGVLARRR